MADRLRDRKTGSVVVLGTMIDDKPALLAMVPPDLVQRGVKAGDVIRDIAGHIDGRGGGRPDLAEAGGKNAAGLDEALAAISAVVRQAHFRLIKRWPASDLVRIQLPGPGCRLSGSLAVQSGNYHAS